MLNVNGEWWIVNGEWWMVNGEWWTVNGDAYYSQNFQSFLVLIVAKRYLVDISSACVQNLLLYIIIVKRKNTYG